MLILNVDKDSAVPAYQQICQRVIGLVQTAALGPGDRLPPTRELARTIGVHRSTVIRAYGELWALGYLESRPGSYSTVRRPARAAATGQSAGQSFIDWDTIATPSARGALEDARRGVPEHDTTRGIVDFARLSADRRLIPSDDVRRCLKAALLDEGKDLLDYGEAAGYRPLREVIARHMRTHGVAVSTEEIVVTGGAQHALDLVLRLLVRAGDRVAIESPTYSAALSLLRLHGVDPVDVPMGPEGMDLDVLAASFERERPVLVYTIPNFQNPTGVTTSQAHRERFLALCEAHRVPIVEDGFEEEMKYFGKAVLPIKSMDARGVVIYVGTFSKVVFPGLRIGWIAAPRECVDRLIAIQRVSCLAGNCLAHAAAERFCRGGLYDRHLRRIHAVYRKRMQAMLKGLADHMPDGVEWTRPLGGYTLWLRVTGARVDESTLCARLRQDGVSVSPGSLYFRTPPGTVSFRLSIACVAEAEITEGCRRLGRSLSRWIESTEAPPVPA